MKTIRIVEWVMFVAVVLGGFLGALVGLSFAVWALAPILGGFASVALMVSAAIGFGALWTYVSVMAWGWLAEHGWFV